MYEENLFNTFKTAPTKKSMEKGSKQKIKTDISNGGLLETIHVNMQISMGLAQTKIYLEESREKVWPGWLIRKQKRALSPLFISGQVGSFVFIGTIHLFQWSLHHLRLSRRNFLGDW